MDKLFGSNFKVISRNERYKLKLRLDNAAKHKSERCLSFAKNGTCSNGSNCSGAHGDEVVWKVDQQMIDKISILWRIYIIKLKQHKNDKNTQ